MNSLLERIVVSIVVIALAVFVATQFALPMIARLATVTKIAP